VHLKPLSLSHVSPRYVAWLNDEQVNRYLETRWQEQTIDTVLKYVDQSLKDPGVRIFAILEMAKGERHIGNIKIGPTNERHQYADLSYLIGEKECWGKGYATEAIKLACEYAFKVMKLHRLRAGLYAKNEASRRALVRNGFVHEGTFARELKFGETWQDHLWFGKNCERLSL